MTGATLRSLAAVTAVLVLIGWPVGPASAHASLVGNEPVADAVYDTAPTEVVLEFDDTVEAEVGGVRVYGPDGGRADDGASEVDAGGRVVTTAVQATSPGTYTVAWSVVSPDSHVISGSFVFHVQTRTGSVAPDLSTPPWVLLAGWLSRWSLLAGTTVLGGVALLRLLTGSEAAWRSRTAHRLALAAAAALLLGAVGRLTVQVLESAGPAPADALAALAPAVLDTRTGLLDLARVVATGLALAGALWWPRARAAFIAVTGVGATMVLTAVSGHAWTAEPMPAAVTADVVHQAGAAVWVGGLAALALVAPLSTDGPGPLARRFSQLALASVVALVLTGVVAAVAQSAADPRALLQSTYGAVLLVKLALVAVMVTLGWTQRRRLARLLDPGRFTATSRLEAGVAVAVLAVTALLVSTVPARESLAALPYEASVTTESGAVSVLVTPAVRGPNDLHLTFEDRVGAPRQVDVARVTASGDGLPEVQLELEPLAGSHWVATGATLPVAGEWTFTLETAGAAGSEELTFDVTIEQAP